MKKIIKKAIPLSIMLIIFLEMNFNYINATLGEGLNNNIYSNVTSEQSTELDGTLSTIASTIMVVLQVLAIAGVVITGVRYMYAGSEDKGKIKQTLIWVIIGSVFVFSASTIISFITNSGNSIL